MNDISDKKSACFVDHEANKQFLALYCGNQRDNPKDWITYFSSLSFLQVATEPEFMALLLKEVEEHQEKYPPHTEFLTWLSIAYQTKRNNDVEPIKEICKLGTVPSTYKNVEWMLSDSFAEYWNLVQMAKANQWNEDSIYKYSKIIENYQLGFIKEKRKSIVSGETSRHPVGVKLLTHFFEQYPLPEELYQILWETLDLKSAKYGRGQVLYGEMRTIVLQHIPTIQEQPKEQLGAFKSDFLYCCAGCNRRAGSNPQKDIEETEAFCARPEFEIALKNRNFVRENLVEGIWIESGTPNLFLEKINDFYIQHPDAPYAEKIIQKIKDFLNTKQIKEKQVKKAKPTLKGIPSLSDPSFFNYWFNICCNTMCVSSARYRYSEFPYNQEWVYQFLTTENNNLDNNKTPYKKIEYSLQDGEEKAEIEIRLHLYYVEFIINGEPTYRPVFDWDWLATIEETDIFFHLLLMTVTLYDRYDIVEQEIIRRLYSLRLTLSKNQIQTIAALFAEHICLISIIDDRYCLEDEDYLEDKDSEESCKEYQKSYKDSSIPPIDPAQLLARLSYVIFMEDSSKLYGALCTPSISTNWIKVFEQPLNGTVHTLFAEECSVNSEDELKQMAMDMLQQQVTTSQYALENLVNLPIAVYLTPSGNMSKNTTIPKELTGQQITQQSLTEAIKLFQNGTINRLEFSWKLPFNVKQEYEARRSLVFLKDGGNYVCLLFDDNYVECYGLPVHQSRYKWIEEDFDFVPFLKEKLFSKHIHKSFHTIEIQLEFVFKSIQFLNGFSYWTQAINVSHGRNKYNIDKQLLGNFPVEWAHNNLSDKIYLDIYPSSFTLTNLQKETETIEIKTSNRFKLQNAFQKFLKGEVQEFCLNWSSFNLVLLQEDRRYMLVFLQNETAKFCVANKENYLQTNEEHSKTELFCGKITPSYLLHTDIAAFRNSLELLLAKLDDPQGIINEFGQYTNEEPTEQWTYKIICKEFLKKTKEE